MRIRYIWTTLGTLLICTLLSTSFLGCSGKPIDESDPGALFKEAEDDLKNDHYQIALEKFRSIKNKFPYSKYSTDSQLRLADVYFMQESFGEAAIAYETFRDLHPKHEKVAYAMFRIGKSYFKDLPNTVARDLTPGHKALDSYGDFLKRFPTAAEADEARKDVADIRKTLAEKELYIADFYLRREMYDSAKNRYSKILSLYPETEPAKSAQTKIALIEKKQPAGAQEQSH